MADMDALSHVFGDHLFTMDEGDTEPQPVEPQGNETLEYINLTPTWSGLLPLFMELVGADLHTKQAEGIYIELKRMAKAADAYNEIVKARNG